MLQRAIYTVLTQAIAAMRNDPTLYTDLFDSVWGLSATEIEGIVAYFAKHPIRVQHGYAMAEVEPPLVAITLQSESQSDLFLGDYVGLNNVAPANYPGGSGAPYAAIEQGSIWEYSYRILLVSENIDVTSYMYEICKAALILQKNYLIGKAVITPTYTGMDLAPDPRYTPENLFTRVLGMRCKRPFILTNRESALGRAFAVSGLAIPPASPASNGNVAANVDVTSLIPSQ